MVKGRDWRYMRGGKYAGCSFVGNMQTSVTVVPPGAPSNPAAAVASDTTVTVTSTAATAGTYPISTYSIEHSLNGTSWTVNGTGSSPYTATGLTANTLYYFRVRAQDTQSNFGDYTSSVTATTYTAQAQDYFDLWSPAADATHLSAVNSFYAGLIADGIYTKLDEFWILANQHEQAGLLGGKLLKNCTNVNATAFVADRGFTGATGKYLNTNFVPSTDGVNYTLNDASFGSYVRTDAAVASVTMGAGTAGTPVTKRSYIITKWSDNKPYFIVNAAGGDFIQGSVVATSLGLWVSRRSASNAQQGFRNGSQIETGAQSSTALTEFAMFILSENLSGTPNGVDTRQASFAFVGASLSATEQSNLFTRVEALGDALGWGVVA